MQYKFNTTMERALLNLKKDCSNIKLINKVGSTLVKSYGCFFLKYYAHNAHPDLSNMLDKTGLECFVNKFHVGDFIDKDFLNEGICFTEHVLRKWKEIDSSMQFVGHVTFDIDDEDDVVVKIHAKRDDEPPYSVEDLNEYELEGVLHILL